MNPRRGTAGASPVLDDEWLAEPLRQLRCLHRHVGCLRPNDRAIQNNSGLPQRRRLGALSHCSLSSWRR